MENKKLHYPTKHGPSNHCDSHDASSGAASACARSPDGRASGPRDGARMEDAPEEGTGTALAGVSAASLLLPLPASWMVRVV
jgi:hypothetical protein